MALEAVAFQNDLFSYGCKDLPYWEGVDWSHDFGIKDDVERVCDGFIEISENNIAQEKLQGSIAPTPANREVKVPVTTSRSAKRRRRTRNNMNKEQVEHQRITHIVVERNRRKQMSEYLTVLRSLMPPSYICKSDQASIVEGAINFVKELEQCLQSFEAQKIIKHGFKGILSSPFADFFTFPQYSSCSTREWVGEKHSSIADIKVTMVECHANLNVLTRRQPKQMLKIVYEFQNLHLTILHLNVTTTIDEMVLYSFSIKVEEGCQFRSVDEVATVTHQMLLRIQEEATYNIELNKSS